MVIWSLSCIALGQVSGMLAAHLRLTPRIEALQAQLVEREETAAHIWTLYQGAHCNLREAQIHLRQWVWRDWDWWPEGDTSGISCPFDPAPSPLFASAEDAAPAEEHEAVRVTASGRRRPLEGDRTGTEPGLRSAGSGLPGDTDTPGSSHP